MNNEQVSTRRKSLGRKNMAIFLLIIPVITAWFASGQGG
jgi:hypothetical protein